MKCKHCGKELVKIGEFTEKEIDELEYISERESTARQALRPDTINAMEFTDSQVFEYFRSAFDAIAEAEFLQHIFFRDLKKRLNIPQNKEIVFDNIDISKDIFVHPDNE